MKYSLNTHTHYHLNIWEILFNFLLKKVINIFIHQGCITSTVKTFILLLKMLFK